MTINELIQTIAENKKKLGELITSLYFDGNLTFASVAKLTGISASTVRKIINEYLSTNEFVIRRNDNE